MKPALLRVAIAQKSSEPMMAKSAPPPTPYQHLCGLTSGASLWEPCSRREAAVPMK